MTKGDRLVSKKINKRFVELLFIVIGIGIAINIVQFINHGIDEKNTHVYFLDVGQGDCIVIKEENYCYMIDGGGDRFMQDSYNKGKEIIHPFLIEEKIKQIDVIFISHVHYDHIKGVLEILELVPVKKVVLPYVYKNLILEKEEGEFIEEEFIDTIFSGGDEGDLLNELMNICERQKIEIVYMKRDDKICGDRVSFTCIYPYEGMLHQENENENSLVLLMESNDLRVLFTGDIEKKGEEWMILNGEIDDIDILKVSHHGSISSSSDAFLSRITPRIGIICVGENLFGHPHEKILERFTNFKMEMYSTQKYGMIDIVIYDSKFKIKPYRE